MSSRRLMNRSLSSDGRSYFSGSDMGSQNRSSGCRSYLSSVRSESRSTLCSVMAQITEDIQPSFDSTLKSKAVSEESNVKFSCVVSGHPVPEVTWYKDDIQLDRYCGLPKYEISRDDKTHTLQIYNCSLDDAAIYQASAQNSRGIVSCSGVLEVGTMSEYKIHQNYFAKLKLRNENRRREQEEPQNTGKENIPAASEPVRMSSPERAQRKRRSPMESSRRAGSPSEERAVEVDALSQTPPSEDRLAAPDQVSAAEAVQSLSNAEMITLKDSEVLTYIHDTVDNASSKVLKKAKILTATTERSKENRTTARREETMNKSGASIEVMEVQRTDAKLASVAESDSKTSKKLSENDECMMAECRNKMDITDATINEKLSIKVNKSALEELKTASESRNKMDITDTKKNEKQSKLLNKSVPEELKRTQFASLTKARNKMDITDTRKSEKQSVNVNKSTSRESKSSVTEYGMKTDVKDTKIASEDSKRTQGPKMAPVTESRNKIDTKTNEKTSLKTNKSTLEESKKNQDVQMASVAESRNKLQNITDTKKGEKQSMNANKSVSVESKAASSAQIASVTESSNKINIKDTKTKTEKLPVKVNKRALEESKINQSAHTASLTEYKNKMGIRDTRKTEKQSINMNKNVSEEKKVQGAQITSVTESKTKVDITETKKGEKQSETPKESASELTKTQKPIVAQKQPALSVSITTPANEVVESTKLTKPSAKGTSNFEAPDTIQNCNPSFIDNKLKDFDDHRDSNLAGTCVRLLPNSCGGNDVNVDTGERNASARSLRGLAAADTHTKPTEPPTREDIPPIHKEVALELKEQPTLMGEVTVSITETQSSCHLASQEQKLRAGDQSVASTKGNTLVTGPQNTELSEKISSGHVSHKLQGGQVTTAMSSSSGDDLLRNMCEEDSKAENQLIKESDKPKSETKPSKNTEENEMKNISADVHVLNTTSEEKSTENSQHSKNQVVVTEFVQICISNSDMVKPQSINGSSVSDVQMKETNAQEFQITSAKATDYVAKKAMQEQSNVTTSEVPISTHLDMQSRSVKKGTDVSGPSTFQPQHSKASPTEFTIPAIYITDVDNTHHNSSEKAHTANNFEIRNELNPATSNVNNTVNHVSDTSDSTDTTNRATAVKFESLNDENFDPSLHSQSSELNSQENVAPVFVKLTEASMKHCDADKSTKTDSLISETSFLTKADLNLSFVKQLKEAALDLGMSNHQFIKFNDAQNMNSKDNVEYVEKANLTVINKETVPLKTTVDQSFSSIAAHSDLSTRTDQKTTFPKTKTENSEIRVAVCLEKANRDAYQEDTLSLKTQHPSSSQSVSNSPLMTSLETNSPRLSRRTVPIDPPKPAGNENIKPKSTEKDKENQFKAPQVIRKIRPEVFDASGHLKLWCQFFNIVSDSTIRWYKDEVEIMEINRSAGDETQLCLAIIQMSKRDCGLYRCTIANEYGKDSTEYLLTTEFFSNLFLREEHHEVGQEIEMTPLIFSKGLADPGCWGSKFYGRVTTEEAQVGLGCEHKTRRLKVIYGLDPVFESGSSCFMKVRSPIVYESREETVLAERNLQITKQDCRIQNMAREYFKIFATEIRVIESFGAALEVIPLYFTYWPASSVPYATVEAELKGVYLRYCGLDRSGSLVCNEKSEVGQKCFALQHWIHQWTNGNVLFSRLEGVDTILTNIGIAVRSKGYQGFPCEANPKVFDQFQIQHQCNYFCGLLNLKPLKAPETLQTPARPKGSSSPLQQRRAAPGSSSPQTPRKGTKSPKVSRKLNPQTST